MMWGRARKIRGIFTRPLWSPGAGGVSAFPLHVSTGNRTRATIKALPASTQPPSPLRNPGPASQVDSYCWVTLEVARRSYNRHKIGDKDNAGTYLMAKRICGSNLTHQATG